MPSDSLSNFAALPAQTLAAHEGSCLSSPGTAHEGLPLRPPSPPASSWSFFSVARSLLRSIYSQRALDIANAAASMSHRRSCCHCVTAAAAAALQLPHESGKPPMASSHSDRNRSCRGAAVTRRCLSLLLHLDSHCAAVAGAAPFSVVPLPGLAN